MNTYRITGLSPAPFEPLYGLTDAALEAQGARRYAVDAPQAFPDRVEMRDASPGESVLLLNFTHQPAATPYRASHAIFVREGATRAYDEVGVLPAVLRSRVLSLRAFDGDGMMIDADIVDGAAAEPLIARLLADPRAAYLHAHYARRGCYAGRIVRA